jgi:CheY-like chemotaxis protein
MGAEEPLEQINSRRRGGIPPRRNFGGPSSVNLHRHGSCSDRRQWKDRRGGPETQEGSQESVKMSRQDPNPPTDSHRRRTRAGPGIEGERVDVLIIEDNPDGRESLQELLEVWGHRVATACDGREGLAKALALRPRVALIDIGLPEIDGNEVARRIRAALNGRRTMSLIAMTGYGRPQDRRRAIAAGFDRFLVKPLEPDWLHRLLEEETAAMA